MAKAYNLNVTPLARVATSKTAKGTDMLKFRATTTIGGKTVERTVVAMGSAAALLKGKVRKGVELGVRALIETAPGTDGKRGGQFLSVVALPRAAAA